MLEVARTDHRAGRSAADSSGAARGASRRLGAGALSDDWAARRLPLHVRRDDFVFLVARDGPELAGFGYGYTGAYKQWWTEHVAERSLRPSASSGSTHRISRSSSCTCDRPGSGAGVGSALLAQLLSRQPHDRALLSTQAGSKKARSFYAKNGWTELADVDFGQSYPPYLVLGKNLVARAAGTRLRYLPGDAR